MIEGFNESMSDERKRKLKESLLMAKIKGKCLGWNPASPEKIEEVRFLLEKGETYREIQKLTGVSMTTIARWKKAFAKEKT